MARTLILLLVSMDVDKTHHNMSHMKLVCLVCHRSLSQHPPLHNYSFSTLLNVVNALKLTKSRKMAEPIFTAIDFGNTEVCDIKHLPPSYKGYILFALSQYLWVFLMDMGIL